MTPNNENAVPKIHPASREILPEDPMDLHGVEVPGDTDLMLRLLVEEYARMGWDAEAIMGLARDPFYQGFHGLLTLHGEEEFRRRIVDILSRCGVVRVTTVETAPAPAPESSSELPCERLVQIQLPPSC